MRRHRFGWLFIVTAIIATQAGCCSERFRANHPRLFGQRPDDPLVGRREVFPPGPPGSPGSPVPSGALGNGEILTPQPYPGDPGAVAPPMNPPNSSGYFPPPANSLRIDEPPIAPAKPMARPDDPAAVPESSSKRPIPQSLDPKASPLMPPMGADASPSVPVGIPGFAPVTEKLATGLKPDPEGFDWLRDKQYRTVLYIRRPGAPHSADKEQVEKRGLKYVSLELSAATLTSELADQFDKLVTDVGNQSLFVYDGHDGAAAGAMWYLHFRRVGKLPAALAKTKAERLGLRESGADEQNSLWAAVQQILADRP